MSIYETFLDWAKEHPERQPGSTGANAIIDKIQEQTAAWDFKAKTQKIPIYHLTVSFWVFIIGSLITIGLSLIHPLTGLILISVLWLLLVCETVQPTLSRLKPGEAENLFLTIPAKSKETQRIVFISSFATDGFTSKPLHFSNRSFLLIIFGLGLATVILLAIGLLVKLSIFSFLALIPVLAILGLALITQENKQGSGLENCSILLELGAILTRARLSNTSVTLYFTGTRSLNSGVLTIPKLLKGGPQLNYVIDLVDLPDKRINLVTTDGLLFPKPSDPLLIEILMEVAREKTIPLQTIKLSEMNATYPLKAKKLKAISITNPLESPDSAKNLRELLAGLLRKLDH